MSREIGGCISRLAKVGVGFEGGPTRRLLEGYWDRRKGGVDPSGSHHWLNLACLRERMMKVGEEDFCGGE